MPVYPAVQRGDGQQRLEPRLVREELGYHLLCRLAEQQDIDRKAGVGGTSALERHSPGCTRRCRPHTRRRRGLNDQERRASVASAGSGRSQPPSSQRRVRSSSFRRRASR